MGELINLSEGIVSKRSSKCRVEYSISEDPEYSLKTFLSLLSYWNFLHREFEKHYNYEITFNKIKLARKACRSHFKLLSKNLVDDHNRLWKNTEKDRKMTINIIKEVIKNYGIYIWKRIPQLTKNKWKINYLKFFLTIIPGSRASEEGIEIGCRPIRNTSKMLSSIIHELIHVNTQHKKRTNLVFEREISTCIFTNMVIDEINDKFNTNYTSQHLDLPYRKYENYISKFEAIYEVKMNFDEFNKRIRKVLLSA